MRRVAAALVLAGLLAFAGSGAAAPEFVPIGVARDIGDGWQLRVKAVVPDATSVILAWNRSNRPPRSGRQFFLVRVEAKRTGTRPGYLHAGWRLRAKGQSVGYSARSNSCGRLPGTDLAEYDPRVFKGGVLDGYVCWNVHWSDAELLLMHPAATRLYFSLYGF